jgi:hypothetical protein
MKRDTPDLHRRTWDVLPWLVNGTASVGERLAAESHLATCSDCRDELAFQLRVQAGMASGPVPCVRPTGLDRLLARMDSQEEKPASSRAAARPRGRWSVRLLASAVVAQAIGIGLLGALLLVRGSAGDATYATLSSTPAAPVVATIRLVAAPSLPLSDLQAMLASNGLRIAGSNAGASILALTPVNPATERQRDTVLARLRATPGVLLAEPLASGSGGP